MITKEEILKELSFFQEYNISDLEKLNEKDLHSLFNEHCEKHSEEVEIIDVYNNYTKTGFLTSTPDGYQAVGNFYKKKIRDIHHVKTVGNRNAKVSSDHMFETSKGWIKTNNIKKTDLILTKDGFVEVLMNEVISKEEVYDWEILHINQRYWIDGISSHNTGKTFLCLNAVREAQKLGYFVIYCDSESAFDKGTAVKFGVNTKSIRYQPVTTINEFKTFMKSTMEIIEAKKAKGEKPKIAVVLDSLGMLGTDKEHNDASEGKNAADMGLKAKELRTLFRVITQDIAKHDILFLLTNHVYTGGGYIPTKEMSGGMGAIFSASSILMLSKAQLKEGDTKTGIIVTSKPSKNRFAKPLPIKFHISFYSGMNKFVGLEEFISWKNCGIERGKFITEKEFEKLKDAEKEKLRDTRFEFVDSETGVIEVLYFEGKETSRTFAVKHLGKTVYPKDLFNDRIFTTDVLTQLDNSIIKSTFTLPDMEDLEGVEGAELEDDLFGE